ncbi:TonB-dependent receptor [Bacteroides sp.]|uniref:TonB-dependent receptor domain-containing protein n=1 Tax=Bacteroides sp. TaxID=29523 RepID=UPI00260DFFD2|nr:TonB-dependent receptor [Bacteroides sp.]MDD3038330.1 TonB-dependent receptor [Bacteroides sp.]
MRHKLFLLSLFVFTLSMSGWAQNSVSFYTVKGVLLDSLTQEGEPYATIKIVNKDAPDKAVKMAVTGANGKFQEKLNVGPGDYILTVSSIGKTTVVREFSLKPSARIVDLGTMLSAEATNELKGVEVVAQKPLVKVDVDKIEYNIEDDPDSKSNSILEMLRKVPLVTVDGEDNVQVNGSSSFKIHINGKPNNMMSSNPKDVLKSMPANSIKYIEVITSPGAKYDAEGIGGILNIVTVGGGFDGYTATIRTSAGNNDSGIGGYAMIKQDKLTLSANYNYNYNYRPNSYSNSYRENYESDTEKYLESQSRSKSRGSFQHGNLEASYEIDSLRLLTVAFGMYGGGSKNNSDGTTAMYAANYQDIAYRYRTDNHGKSSWYSINGNIDYQRTARSNKARMITLSYKINTQPQTDNSYNTYLDISPEDQTDNIVDRLLLRNYHSDGKTNNIEHTFQVDYTTPIGKLHTIETGAKYILRRNSSDNQFFEAAGVSDDYLYNEDRSSDYRHLNHILAAYAGYTLKYKVFSFKPGVRYEQTIQRVKYIVGPGENFNSNFSDWVPSASLGMQVGKTQNIRGSYSMRIWRPGIWNLNPYFNNQNPMFISQGNPDLKTVKSHAFDLSYSNFTAKFNINVALRYSFQNNGIENISRLITAPGGEIFDDNPEHLAPEGALYSTYANIGKRKETGLNLFLNWNATSKTRIYMNGRGDYTDLRSEAQGLHNYGWNASVHGGIQHTLPWKIRLSLNAGGRTPNISLQGKGSGFQYYSFGINRSFLKEERLTLNVYCSNIFEKYRHFDNHTEGINFISKSSSKYPSRYFGFSLSYRIGELKASVKKAARTINNDDVKEAGREETQGGVQ